MASRMLRRSGVACGLVADVLNWRADTIVQVGVGVHHQETNVLQQEWPGVEFIGFDPLPCNDYPGMFFQYAVSDRIGTATLFVKCNHKDGSSLYKPVNPPITNLKEITVQTITLDSFLVALRGKPRILLWLDCEGNELNVLKGAEDFINRVQMVNVEMTTRRRSPEACHPLEVHQWLSEHGFLRQWIHTGRISAGQYDAVYVVPKIYNPDYGCDPWTQGVVDD